VRIILFNVGHGFCAFVKSESGATLLIDCGCSENFSPVKYIVENELDGVVPINGKYLTKMIVTHPHDDHIKDISRLIQLLPPYLLLRTKFKWEDVKTPNTDESEYENLNEYAAWQESYSAVPVQAPDWGKVSIQTFKVPQLLVSGCNNSKAVNNSSYAVVVTYTGSAWVQKFLFGGDLEESGWKELLATNAAFRNAVAGVTFNFPSHHGHGSGYCGELFDAIGSKPHMNLISVTDKDPHVDGNYSQQANGIHFSSDFSDLRKTLTTRTHGSIFIDVNETGYATVYHRDLPDNVDEIPAYLRAILGSVK
jgi:beta-lactamase superfamily II metal-dependent hydrolase